MANELIDEINKLVEYQTGKFRKLLEHSILDILKSQMNQLEKRIIGVIPKLDGSDDGGMYGELPIDPDCVPEVKEVWNDDEQYGEIRNLEKLINELEDDNPVKKGIIEKVKRMKREKEESEKIKRKLKKKRKKKKRKKRKKKYKTDQTKMLKS